MASRETKMKSLSSSKERKKKVTVQKPKSRSRKSGPKARPSSKTASEKSPTPSEDPCNTSVEEKQNTVDKYFLASSTSSSRVANEAEPDSLAKVATPQVEGSSEEKHSAEPQTLHISLKNSFSPSAKKKLSQRTLKGSEISQDNKQSRKNTNRNKKISQLSVDKRQSGITDHFYVRRSGRKCASTVKEEEQRRLEEAILTGKEDGLEVRHLGDKGRGVFSAKAFRKGEMVCEYAGELITYEEAKKREQKYQERPEEFGCYMYYFAFRNKKYCVDATAESGRLGRLLNHSRTANNVITKQTCIKDTPHLILVAARDISIGEELLYDYGERNKEAINSHPWLNL